MTVIVIFPDDIDAAEERFACFHVHGGILSVRGNVGDDKDLGVTSLTVEVPAGKQQRIAVQIVQHIAVL